VTNESVDLSVRQEEPNMTLPSVSGNHEIKLAFGVIRKPEPPLRHEVRKEAIAGL
jgi:hypothetical protein